MRSEPAALRRLTLEQLTIELSWRSWGARAGPAMEPSVGAGCDLVSMLGPAVGGEPAPRGADTAFLHNIVAEAHALLPHFSARLLINP